MMAGVFWIGSGTAQKAGSGRDRQILFLAGPDSHGWGQHKHFAGCAVLAQALETASEGFRTEVIREWPSDEALRKADALVIYADGWEKHPANGKLGVLEEFMDAGKGLVVLHWATGIGVPDMKATDQSASPERARWRKLVGADFEPFYSVSRVWTSDFANPASHPVTRGVKPFSLHDECYFHLRGVGGDPPPAGLLTDRPPAELIRRDLHRGQGNPQALAAVVDRGEEQHMAWAHERPGGGRAFGWTGGHFHWTWARDEARMVALNAIAWASGAEVPAGGLASPRPSAKRMLANLSGDNPGWKVEELQRALNLAADSVVVPWKEFDREPLVAGGPQPIFDGKSLKGWQVNKGEEKWWRVKDGAIEGGSLSEHVPHNTFLVSAGSYQNFELRLKMKITPVKGGVNSGIQVRSVRVPEHHEMIGYQADAGGKWWGKLYDESRRRKVIGEPQDAAAVTKAVKPTGWNDYRIRCEGSRTRTWLNGVAAVDYAEEGAEIPLEGRIGLQVHGGGTLTVQFRDITVERLPRDPHQKGWQGLSREPWPKAPR